MKLPFRYMITAFVIAFVVFALSAGVMIYFWLSAVWGVGIFAATILPIIIHAGIGGFFLDPTRARDGIADDKSPDVKSRIKGMTLPIIGASIPFVLVLTSWQLPGTRAVAVDLAGTLGLRVVVESGLTDRSPDVALAGCHAVEETDPSLSRDLLVRRLFVAQDEEVVACMLHALPGEIDGKASMRLQALAAKWERELWTETVDPDRACALADHLRQAERSGADLASPRLLTCAVGAPDSAARQCCAQALRGSMGGAPTVASVLPSPERAIGTSGMVERLDLVISAPTSSDPDVRSTLGLDEPEFEAWSLRLGCESFKIWRNEVRERAGAAMTEALSGTCDVAPPSESTVGIWNQTCTEASATLNPSQFDEALCEGLNRRFVIESMALARRDVTRAHRIATTPPRASGFLRAMMQMGALTGNSEDLSGMPELPAGLGLEQIELLRGNDQLMNFGDAGALGVFLEMMQGAGGDVTPEQMREAIEAHNPDGARPDGTRPDGTDSEAGRGARQN